MRETAASHFVRKVPTANAAEEAGTVRARLCSQHWGVIDDVYLVDDGGRLVGSASEHFFAPGA